MSNKQLKESLQLKVKNKTPAPIQITAEQLVREAFERRETGPKPINQVFQDKEELNDYQFHKRKSFEDSIRRTRNHMGIWIKYAAWEESQKEVDRARSVYERALKVDPRNTTLYIKYSEMEMKHKMINHARNVLDRAITLLPRIDQFWYKWAYFEEVLGNVKGARQVFERWMQWEPKETAWLCYIKLEKRYKEFEKARIVYHRFVYVHSDTKNWLKWAKFEEDHGDAGSVRQVFQMALDFQSDDTDHKLLIAFAKFEVKQKEIERARCIYKYGLENLPKDRTEGLYKSYTLFEKQHGGTKEIEDVVVGKRRWQYEEDLKDNPYSYDTWLDYAKLEESQGDLDRAREVYERAVAQIPPTMEKKHWARYIFIWIYYAFFEELEGGEVERARQVYRQCLFSLIPHKKFTFAKLWLLYAKFEIRNQRLTDARKALGTAIGMCPKAKLFKGYIELELKLREFDRCRILYEKFLLFAPSSCYAWIKFAEMEKMLLEYQRSRAIFDLAVGQEVLDMPEVLWKAYIDFECQLEEWDYCRSLYELLLEKTDHVKVWLSYAKFEFSTNDISLEQRIVNAQKLFKRANQYMKDNGLKEDRLIVLETWRDFEKENGGEEDVQAIEAKMPHMVKKRKKTESGMEDYYDYVYPDDEAEKPNIKLLNMAHEWKQKMESINSTKANPQ